MPQQEDFFASLNRMGSYYVSKYAWEGFYDNSSYARLKNWFIFDCLIMYWGLILEKNIIFNPFYGLLFFLQTDEWCRDWYIRIVVILFKKLGSYICICYTE